MVPMYRVRVMRALPSLLVLDGVELDALEEGVVGANFAALESARGDALNTVHVKTTIKNVQNVPVINDQPEEEGEGGGGKGKGKAKPKDKKKDNKKSKESLAPSLATAPVSNETCFLQLYIIPDETDDTGGSADWVECGGMADSEKVSAESGGRVLRRGRRLKGSRVGG
jgi:hypothetical protein